MAVTASQRIAFGAATTINMIAGLAMTREYVASYERHDAHPNLASDIYLGATALGVGAAGIAGKRLPLATPIVFGLVTGYVGAFAAGYAFGPDVVRATWGHRGYE